MNMALLSIIFLMVSFNAFSQNPEDQSQRLVNSLPTTPFGGAIPDFSGTLFVGTATNSSGIGGTANDVFSVDTNANSSNSIIAGEQAWGATADPANSRVLYSQSDGSCFGCRLMSVPYTGGSTSILGNITLAGADFRIDGLAISGGVLYGSNADAANNGIYSIDINTLAATLIIPTVDSISGIDADPDTGNIYGVNDSTAQLVIIDPVGLTINNVAAYPAGFLDIDGLAIGGGNAYLITDESQDINVYNFTSGTYTGVLTSPFLNSDTFSAGAFAASSALAPPVPVPTLNGLSVMFLILLMLTMFVGKYRKEH